MSDYQFLGLIASGWLAVGVGTQSLACGLTGLAVAVLALGMRWRDRK